MGNEYYIQKKFWGQVEGILLDILNNNIQQPKGILNIPLGVDKKGKKRGVCLNLDGKGFVLTDLRNNTIYAPEYITYLVQEIYLRDHGKTEYFLDVLKRKKFK